MAKYRVSIRGENIPLVLEGVSSLYGFYTHRYVKAKAEDDARALALKLVVKEIEKSMSRAQDTTFVVEERLAKCDSYEYMLHPVDRSECWLPSTLCAPRAS